MNKIIIIIFFSAVGYFAYNNFISDKNGFMMTDGKEIVFENGDNTFAGEIVSSYNEKLRIYGINNNDSGDWSPIAYAKFMFVASPFIGDTDTCEENSASQAPILNIIVDDVKLLDKIGKLKMVDGRRKATVIGDNIYIKKFTYKGEDHTGALKKQGKIDPRNAILVREIVL
ncbi:MAG: hypothetical protein D3925_02725 [Candidatus Electrothrix sp. AR5]|nr:hypothetical protein [Candidatus Electrothrix sp. AR5]